MVPEQMGIRVLNALLCKASTSWTLVLDAAFADPSAAAIGILNIVPKIPYPR